MVVVGVSQFNGTSTPKGLYIAKTGDNDCNVNSSGHWTVVFVISVAGQPTNCYSEHGSDTLRVWHRLCGHDAGFVGMRMDL